MKQLAIILAVFGVAALVLSCAGAPNAKYRAEAQAFLDGYTRQYVALYAESSEAE